MEEISEFEKNEETFFFQEEKALVRERLWFENLFKDSTDTVTGLFCSHRILNSKVHWLLVQFYCNKSLPMGYVLTDVQYDNLGNDAEGNPIDNKRGNKAILTFTKISSLCQNLPQPKPQP